MEFVSIKEIQEEDYETVMKIKSPETVYGGFDYLPDYYPVLMHTPGYRAFGAFIGEKLVAFTAACLIDEGKSWISRAGRISPEYEGKHIMGKIRRHLEGIYLPFIERQSFSFSDAVKKLYALTMADKRSKILFKKGIHTYRTRQESIMVRIEKETRPTNVKICVPEDLVALLQSRDFCEKLFPEDRLFVDHVPYRLLKANVPYIFSHRCMALGTNLKANVTANECLLTFGNYVVCYAGILYNIDIYGQNFNELYNHLLVHLDRLRIMTNTDIQVEIICNDNIDGELCNDIMQKFGFNRIKFFRTHLYCAEITYKKLERNVKTNVDQKAKL